MIKENVKPTVSLLDTQVGWAIVKRKRSLLRGQYFTTQLVGRNGEVIMIGETYTQRHNITSLLIKYFPNFRIVDY